MQRPLDEARVQSYRKKFPITETGVVYLNHAGMAPTSTPVREAVDRWFESAEQGDKCEKWEESTELCRRRFADLLRCSPDEVAFVRNTSHGLSLVAEGYPWQEHRRKRPRQRRILVTPAVEYPSNVHPWTYLARKHDLTLEALPPRDGGADLEAIRKHLRSGETILVAVSSAQYGSGAVTDMKAIGELCRENGALFCVDGIQTIGALPIDVHDAKIDFLSADSHKWLLGMLGMGAFYVRQDLAQRMAPPLIGWKSMAGGWGFNVEANELLPDARRFEEGSHSYALIDGFSAALEMLHEVSVEAIAERLRGLVERLADRLEKLGCMVRTPPHLRHHILSFTHPGMETEGLGKALNRRGVVVTVRGGGVRASPHFYNTEDEMDQLADAVAEIVG